VVQSAVIAELRVSPITTPMPWSMNTRWPIFAPEMNLDAGEKTRDVRHEAGEPAHPDAPQPVRQTMNQERVKTGRTAACMTSQSNAHAGRVRIRRLCLREFG